jgi:hypothetical protein
VITQEQIDEMSSLLSDEIRESGGNYRNIQEVEQRTIYQFSNDANIHAAAVEAAKPAHE